MQFPPKRGGLLFTLNNAITTVASYSRSALLNHLGDLAEGALAQADAGSGVAQAGKQQPIHHRNGKLAERLPDSSTQMGSRWVAPELSTYLSKPTSVDENHSA